MTSTPKLAYVLIYAVPPIGQEPDGSQDEDSLEASQVLLYYSTRNVQTRDKMLRHLGLAKGLDNFAGYRRPSLPALFGVSLTGFFCL